MSLYRKKPVEVEAQQFTGGAENAKELILWMCFADDLSTTDAEWRAGAHHEGRGGESDDYDPEHLLIDTLEGTMRADLGDWIICGVKSEFYPCKPDVFEATYEPAEQTLTGGFVP